MGASPGCAHLVQGKVGVQRWMKKQASNPSFLRSPPLLVSSAPDSDMYWRSEAPLRLGELGRWNALAGVVVQRWRPQRTFFAFNRIRKSRHLSTLGEIETRFLGPTEGR